MNAGASKLKSTTQHIIIPSLSEWKIKMALIAPTGPGQAINAAFACLILGIAGRDLMGELEKTVAIVFKRKGKSMLSEREFVNVLLFDMRWSDPGKSPKIGAADAQRILDAAVRSGLLALSEGVLKPSFDYKTIDIPLNYMPSKAVLDELGPGQQVIETTVPRQDRAEDAKPLAQQTSVENAPLDDIPLDVPLFSVLIEDIAQRTGLKKKDLVAKINRLQDRLKVVPEVAALVVAREHGMDISKYYNITKEEIMRK